MTPLLLVAVRTEGSEPARDLIEIAVARCDPADGSHSDVYMARVRTSRGAAAPSDAVPLEEAMDHIRELGRGCVFTAWEASVTRTFLDDLCLRWELAPLEFAPNTLDLQSLAWMLAMVGDARSARLEDIASALEITFAPQAYLVEQARQAYTAFKDRVNLASFTAFKDRAVAELKSRWTAFTGKLGFGGTS